MYSESFFEKMFRGYDKDHYDYSKFKWYIKEKKIFAKEDISRSPKTSWAKISKDFKTRTDECIPIEKYEDISLYKNISGHLLIVHSENLVLKKLKDWAYYKGLSVEYIKNPWHLYEAKVVEIKEMENLDLKQRILRYNGKGITNYDFINSFVKTTGFPKGSDRNKALNYLYKRRASKRDYAIFDKFYNNFIQNIRV